MTIEEPYFPVPGDVIGYYQDRLYLVISGAGAIGFPHNVWNEIQLLVIPIRKDKLGEKVWCIFVFQTLNSFVGVKSCIVSGIKYCLLVLSL